MRLRGGLQLALWRRGSDLLHVQVHVVHVLVLQRGDAGHVGLLQVDLLGLETGPLLLQQDLVGVVGHGGVVILQAAVLMQHGVLKGLLCDTGQKSVPSARLQMILNVNFL